eukprot:5793614-Amphidinium_carterae.1
MVAGTANGALIAGNVKETVTEGHSHSHSSIAAGTKKRNRGSDGAKVLLFMATVLGSQFHQEMTVSKKFHVQ